MTRRALVVAPVTSVSVVPLRNPPSRSRAVVVALASTVVVLLVAVTFVSSVGGASASPVAGASPALLARIPGLPPAPALRAALSTNTTSSVPDDWSWTQWSTGVGPSPRYEPMMADDPAEHGVLLWGGTSLPGQAILNDTWLYRGGIWTELCSGTAAAPRCAGSPSPRVAAQLAYDPERSGVVLFGGAKAFNDVNDTWLFANGSWENLTNVVGVAPPVGDSLPVATDPQGGVLLVVTRESTAETWELGPSGWSQVVGAGTPWVPDLQPMWFDQNLGVDVLWDQGSGTWEFVDGVWTTLATASAPPVSGGLPEGGGYDSAFGYGFVYAPLSTDRSTWAFEGGDWTNVTANVSAGPPTTNPLGIAFDTSDGYVLALEDVGSQEKDVQTWILHDPFTLRLNDSIATRDIGQPATLSITASGGISPYGVTVQRTPPGCGPVSNTSNESSIECVMTRTGTFDLTVLAHDDRDLYLPATLEVLVDPTLGASAYATPNPVTAGFPVAFFTNISGGAAPYSVAWQIPGGPLHTTPTFTTTLATPGIVPVNLTVTDSADSVWSATLPLSVLPALSVAASVDRAGPDHGDPLQFTASLGGGIPPTGATWQFGDGTGAAGASVQHWYQTPGNFTASVTALDALGTTATSSVQVTVHGKLSVHPAGPGTSVPLVGAPVDLSAGIWGGTPPFEVTWTFGNGGTSNVTNPTPTFPVAGNTTVTESVTDGVGATANGTLVLDIQGPSNASLPVGPAGTDVPGMVESAGVVVAGAAVAAAVWVVRRGRQASA
jgi:hypothetical protein